MWKIKFPILMRSHVFANSLKRLANRNIYLYSVRAALSLATLTLRVWREAITRLPNAHPTTASARTTSAPANLGLSFDCTITANTVAKATTMAAVVWMPAWTVEAGGFVHFSLRVGSDIQDILSYSWITVISCPRESTRLYSAML